MSNRIPRTFCLLTMIAVLSAPGAFAQGGSTTRIEQDDPNITYSGNWYTNDSPNHSGGVATLTNFPGARVMLSFTGTGITWVGVIDGYSGLATVYVDGKMTVVDSYADQWSGVARVYIDGELKGHVDNYLSPSRERVVVYSIDGLPSGTHTMTIEATGTRNESSKGSWIWLDSFDIVVR